MWTTARKYAGLYGAFFKASFIADLEYRANFATRIFTDIIWYAAQIYAFEVIYQHTELIGSWNRSQTRVFLGLLFVVDAIYMIFTHDNLDKFSDKVRKGELDLILTKPVNSQFMVSLQRVSTAMIGNLGIALAWLIFSLARLPDFSWWRVLWLVLLIPSGVVILYVSRFVMSSIAILVTRAENVQFIWYQVYKLGMRPDSIYLPWLKTIFLTFVPVSLVASVPSRALMDPPEPLLFLWAPVLSGVLLWLSGKYWTFCLRFYSSASS